MMNLICKPDDKRIVEFLQDAMLSDKFIDIRIHRHKASNKQIRYVHALFSIFGFNFGYTPDEAKQIVKGKFLEYKTNGKSGVILPFIKSLADLDSLEMTNFIESFRKLSSENGLYLPSPNEFYSNESEVMNEINNYNWH